MSKLNEDSLKYIIARLVENANDAVEEDEKDKSDAFNQGRHLTYIEMLDILKNELDVPGCRPQRIGLRFRCK